MKLNRNLFVGAVLLIGSITANAQSLLNLVDSVQGNKQPAAPLESTWKDTRLINAQTTKTPAPGVMLFRIMHRFGDAGGTNGGIQTFYGFDVVTDIYLSFDFGITKNLQLGFGRSKDNQLLDGSFKYKLLTQKSVGMPITFAVYGDMAITPESDGLLYGSADSTSLKKNFADKLSYFGEAMLDRKFGNVGSLEIFGGISHRNFVLHNLNPANNAYDQNDMEVVGTAGRIRLTKHASLVFEYFYMMSPFRMNNPTTPYYNGFSVGYEIETGGHVFEVNFSNMDFINENNFIPYTNETWSNGGFKLGFSISRAFNL